jgi:hypothetical protein
MGSPSVIFALIIAGLVLTVAVVLGLIAVLVGIGLKPVACFVALISSVLAGSVLSLVVLLLGLAALALLYWFIFVVHRLPLVLVGLGNLTHIPAVPFRLSELPGTVVGLGLRSKQTEQAKEGLSTEFTIGGRTTDGYTFMYGTASDSSYTKLSLEAPEQFAMGWTTFGNVYHDATPFRSGFADALRDKERATAQFWPNIAGFGLVLNLIVLENVSEARGGHLKAALGAAWTDEMQALQAAGALYVIDMTFFDQFPVSTVDGFPRFTPATLTFLKRESEVIVPFAIRVSGMNGAGMQHFVKSDPAWLYALQAAKTSITVWGIWLGHVYHWHIVTAAMQMTMFQTFGARHIVRQLLGRQSNYLIAFDQFLLLVWGISPPTSVSTSAQFLQMMDAFAAGRRFSADDPKTTIAALGLRKEDFTVHDDWDQYPVVRYLLAIWAAAERYVGTVIDANYASDDAVGRDAELQTWIKVSGDRSQGNVAGLPLLDTKDALKGVLTSLIFRITAHGAARLNQAANPALTFVANFPPCLQDPDIPRPDTEIDTARLLAFLPKTGTIGSMVTFLFTFIYSTPYESFIPLGGVNADQSFTGATAAACNAALVQFRRDVMAFMDLWAQDAHVPPTPAQEHQWALNIET